MLASALSSGVRTGAPNVATLPFIATQLALLWAVATVAHGLVAASHLPLPGNVVGLLLMLGLLHARIVRIEWCEAAAALVVRHMSLFFVPLAVGAVAFAPLFVRAGLPAVAILATSAAVGIVVAGRTVAAFVQR